MGLEGLTTDTILVYQKEDKFLNSSIIIQDPTVILVYSFTMVIKTYNLSQLTLQHNQGAINLKHFGETAATIDIFFNSGRFLTYS